MVTAPLGPRLRLRLRIALARHRRGVVAALAALAVLSALSVLRPPSPATARVLVARRDLPAGHHLTAADLLGVSWATGALPAGLLTRPAGRVLAGPLRRGEPVTDVRVRPAPGSGPGSRPTMPEGRVAMTLRLTDPASALLVSPGLHVQVIAGPPLDPATGAAPSSAATARVVVRDALVLAAPPGRDDARASPAASPGRGLLGALSGSPAGSSGGSGGSSGGSPDGALGADGALPASGASPGSHDLPAGVLAVAVRPDDALALAAVTGTRTLTVAGASPSQG